MHLRNRLLVLVLSVLIPAFIAATIAVAYVYQEEQGNREKALSEAARAFALVIDNELQTREAVLRTLALSPALAEGDWRAFYDYARQMAPTDESAIIVMLPNGEQLVNTRRPFGSPLPTRTVSNLFELASKHGDDKTLVSDVFVASVGKRHDFAISVPVVVGDGTPYILVMGINAAALNRTMAAQRFPQQWIATIVDRQGKVVARSRDPEQYVGKPVRDYSRKILAARMEGVYPSVTLDGVQVKAFFSRVPLADWRAIISLPESEIHRTSVQATAFLGTVIVVLLIFSVLAARAVARLVIAPIEELGRAAERLGRGDEVIYKPHGLREVDAVGEAVVQAGEKIQRSRSELRQRVDEAVEATKRVEGALLQSRKLEALGRLTGGIAHEFNNVLQTLTASLQLASLTTAEPRTRDLVQTSQKAVDRGVELTRQLGAFGRVQDARMETIALNERISGFLPLIRGALPTSIDFRPQLDHDVWPVRLDPLQLELALLNIAFNARDAMPEGGALVLDVNNASLQDGEHGLPSGDYVRVSMTDNGAGMRPEELARAVDPFFTTKPVGKGSGLGLAQAYAFANQAAGTLVLHSELGKGTRVEIFLPRASATPGAVTPSSSAGMTAPDLQDGCSILFVEDDHLVREAIVPALEGAGFTVSVAPTGDHALAVLNGPASFDALFSDIVMPGRTNGIELATEARRRFPQMKIVLATGYSQERVDIPGVDLLAKPYDVDKAIRLLSGGRRRG
ncbi:MAG TPA: cache domain-containing protein [Noviherbaspirillum sp.]|jgi:signal transduction histidine kinase|uniref:hybrid sensor histidine kinase/response regulator n=1 Tax=Noviherbaspirillum sp. TaxID=1926288 RepID=UPI002F93E534